MRPWVTVFAAGFAVFAASCLPAAAVDCGDGRWCPTGTICFAGHCAAQEQIDACAGGATDCTTSQIPDGRCVDGVCIARTCDDGILDPPEQCEDLGDAPDNVGTTTCQDLGFYTGQLACEVDTCQFDVTGCAERCGDDVVNGPELCDGALPGRTCLDYGFDQGAASCSSACGVDFADCGLLGWRSELVASLLDFAVLDDDLIGVVAGDSRFYFYVPSTGALVSIHPQVPMTEQNVVAQSVQRGPDGLLWGLAKQGGASQVYRYDAAVMRMAELIAPQPPPPAVLSIVALVPLANGFLITANSYVTHVDLNGQVVATASQGALHARSDGTATGAVLAIGTGVSRWDGSAVTPVATVTGVGNVDDVLARPDGSIWAMGRDSIQGDCSVWRVGQGPIAKIFRTMGQSSCTGFALGVAGTPVIVTTAGTFAWLDNRFQLFPGPAMRQVGAASTAWGLDSVGLFELLPERWQVRHHYIPATDAPPDYIQFLDVLAIDDDEYLYGDGISVLHHTPSGSPLTLVTTPGIDLCRRDTRFAVVGFGSNVQDCAMGQTGACDLIQGPPANTNVVIDCTGDTTEPVWVGHRNTNGTDGSLLRAFPPGAPAPVAAIRPYSIAALPGQIALAAGEWNGDALVLQADAGGVIEQYRAPGPPLLAIHACAPDRWFAGGLGYVVVRDGATITVETLPYPNVVLRMTGTPTCDRVFAIAANVVFERRDGRWRAIRAINPGITVLGATMLGDRLLMSRRLSIEELRLSPP
jgi:hypothetical protein